MSETVIKVENLSKKYVISHQQKERYTALRDVMTRSAKNFGHKLLSPFTARHPSFPKSKEDFYALKDISFEIKQGERVGIIGRNGAGKSTLLKLLSRITEPTAGRIEITGRAASLLEVGTGFHPELTGRENIFLNGAILGMSREEIKRKFDEIVYFAEIEKFLDTPVKRYSSGMYVRLAFAVAAHLETEILLVDEVLAVGDAQFQKKCLGKMEAVSQEGRTLLFVSHNMAAVLNLCRTAILLDWGKASKYDDVELAIQKYMSLAEERHTDVVFKEKFRRFRHEGIELTDFKLIGKNGVESTQFVAGESLKMKFYFSTDRTFSNIALELYIVAASGTRLVYGGSNPLQDLIMSVEKGNTCIECEIPELWLTTGSYHIDAIISIPNITTLEYVERASEFTVVWCNPFGTSYNMTTAVAPVLLPHRWTKL